jgi:hypothetical protein
MGKKSRLSHDQKRKAKLKETRRAHAHTLSLAYSGNKYKKDEFVPLVFETELAIFEAYRMTDQAITDHDVRAALEKLVLGLRHGELPPLEDPGEIRHAEGDEQDFLIGNIRRHWELLSEKQLRFGTEDRIGVVRTLLNSVDTWGTAGPQSRGYLHFLEGFMKKAGVSVDAYDESFQPLPATQEDEMLGVGRDWCIDGDQEAARAFRDWVARSIRAGQAQRVVDVCQQLLGEISSSRDMGLVSELSALSLQAHAALKHE